MNKLKACRSLKNSKKKNQNSLKKIIDKFKYPSQFKTLYHDY